MRPQLFQCKYEGKVFKDGRCLATTSSELEERCSRAICRLGEKRTSDKCNEFSFCQKKTTTSGSLTVHWQSYRCLAPRVFNPVTGQCVMPNEYQCPLREGKCVEGHSHSVECQVSSYSSSLIRTEGN